MGKIRNTPTHPAGDRELVDGLLGFASGGDFVLEGARPLQNVEDTRTRFTGLLATAIHDQGDALAEFFNLGGQSLATMPLRPLRLQPVLVTDGKGYRLKWLREFRGAADALDYAFMLVLDHDQQYGAALCRCRLPRCSKFYLARLDRRGTGGGRANRNYCSPEHRKEAHDKRFNRTPRKPK